MQKSFQITLAVLLVVLISAYQAMTYPDRGEKFEKEQPQSLRQIDKSEPGAAETERKIVEEMDRRTAETTTIDLTVEEPFGGDEDGSPPEDEIPAGMSPP